ncbi:MAG: hypothetical protein WCS99_21740, partial [Limisphaerales bacterium]
FRLFSLPVPADAQIAGTVNAADLGEHAAAVMAAEPNVEARSSHSSAPRADRAGCSHEFAQTGEAKAGRHAARFTATSDSKSGGWSMRGKNFPVPLDLTGCKAIRAWVHGDGKGEQLKIQLQDGAGGYRDNYLPINFQGWRQVTLTNPPINSLRYDRVATIGFYYNSLPAGQTVTCMIDHVEAIIERDGGERAELLEDFEDADSPLWSSPVVRHLQMETSKRHGVEPAAFGVIASARAGFMDALERFEPAAGLPSPRPGGVWNKKSPWTKRSYFFLTSFSEPQFDEALAIARRGGFHTILLGQETWCQGTGHYEVNRKNFPDGLDGLKRTVQRFKDAGFRVGLHFLGPSVYAPDPYLTPVPDPRLVKGATTALAADVDATTNFLQASSAPGKFPAEDGGYTGDGTVVQVGNELIWYGGRTDKPPFGFNQCRRGYLGTVAAPHQKGDLVAHLVRSYGYHMFDMDTSLLDEVAAHFSRVANTCGIDMIYFDGSERLQGDHWYYNARLHKAFFDKLANKNTLLQASSYSHYSWHLLARSASADGHGDLKGYLDERSNWFTSFAGNWMPLDIGWYYGYDPASTPDQYEYVLGATISYDSSMSFQVSTAAAAAHPFTGEILDLIARYEKLRLSGRVPAAMMTRLRIDPAISGKKPEEIRGPLRDKRIEFRLLEQDGKQSFQRVIYDEWHAAGSGPQGATWKVQVKGTPARVGVQIHAQHGPWLDAGPSYRSPDALLLESFDDLAPYSRGVKQQAVRVIEPGQAGSVSPGVTQRLESSEQDAREGSRCATYSAQNANAGPGGWSAIGRSFSPPLDISWHKAIGFWMRGDGHGGKFKLQLQDSAKAMDYYVENNFTGWRYQQPPRPGKDSIDYRNVRTMTFYYNGLPGRTNVSCGIDDVKALRALDQPAIVDPHVELGGQRWTWQGTLNEGQYLFFWPGEPISRYGRPLEKPERLSAKAMDVTLPPGEYPVTFGCRDGLKVPVRIRVTLQPPERHDIP